jgi:hypothetical protein
MKTNTQFLYFAHFFLDWEIFQNKFVDKLKTHILCSITFFFRKSCRLYDNVGKFFRAGQATDDNKCICALRAGYPRLQTHAHTHNMYYLLTFHCNNGCTNAPQRYVIVFYETWIYMHFKIYLQKCAIRTRSMATGKWHVILHLQRKAVNDKTSTLVWM